MREAETALGVPGLHLEDPVHADGRASSQARLQQSHPCVPQLAAEAPPTELRPHDEEAHEAEGAFVADDGAATDELVVELRCDEGSTIGLPEDLRVVKPWVPALVGGPTDQSGGLLLSHQAQGQGFGHVVLLLGKGQACPTQRRASQPESAAALCSARLGASRLNSNTQGGSMPHRRLLAVVAALSIAAVSALPAAAQDERPHGPPDATPNPVAADTPAGDGTAVRVTTELGDIVIGLFNESAPVASENFYNLATEGYYDGVGFHRSVPGFVLQGGDPDGTGAGGPGYTIPDEEVVGQYGRGVVAMARTQEPNSQGSQFFIVLDDAAEGSLEALRTYTIFGRVIEGMDVVDAIVAAREPSDRIEDPVRIISTSVEQVELPPEPTPEPPSAVEAAADELASLMPQNVAGYDLQQAVFTLEQVGAQFDREVLAELQGLAESAGADLSLMSIAQASAGDDAGFVSVAAASIPGLPGETALGPIAKLLLPNADTSAPEQETIGGRETSVIDLGDGQMAYVFASGDVVWFVITTVEDVESIVSSLP